MLHSRRNDSATDRRDVFMTARQLTPPFLGKSLQFNEYAVSADGRRVLFATNGRPTMIRTTACDYWTLELNEQSSFMEYPNRHHGIGGLRIDTLRWEFITEHLAAAGR